MSRIREAFVRGKAMITFLPAGDPSPDRTREFLTGLVRAGADVIGIVLPVFGQADGSGKGGMIGSATEEVFQLCRSFREKEKKPLVLMTVAAAVYDCGAGMFFQKCCNAGIDGVILPGISKLQEKELRPAAKKNGIDWIPAVSAAAQEEIAAAAAGAEGFLYLMSGGKEDGRSMLPETLQMVRQLTEVPVVIGFGIHTTDQATEAARISDGIAVGSIFANMISQYGGHAAPHIYTYARMMREAVRASER